tara:strand:+ start:2947 stop:3327 length:381 start_codon:yes stop_codon:yes gene_type:complete
MAVSFPSLTPTQRTYTVGEYPTKRFNSISGAGTTRLYGSKAFDAVLDLRFSVNDADLAKILECFNSAYGPGTELNLPQNIFNGMSSALQAQIPNYVNWRWQETPQVRSVFNDRSSVTVKLIGTLDG